MGFFSSIGNAFSSAASWVGDKAKTVGKAVGNAAVAVGKKAWEIHKYVTNKVSTVLSVAGHALSKVPIIGGFADAVGSLADMHLSVYSPSPENPPEGNGDAASEPAQALAAATDETVAPLGSSDVAQALAAATAQNPAAAEATAEPVARGRGVAGIGDGQPGVFGIGDGKPGVFGIGTGKGKARKEAEAMATKAGFSAADVKKAGDRAAAWVGATGTWDRNIYATDMPAADASPTNPQSASTPSGGGASGSGGGSSGLIAGAIALLALLL